jgi:small conductance mechanosensitive channel
MQHLVIVFLTVALALPALGQAQPGDAEKDSAETMDSASDASALTDDWQRLLGDWSQKIGVSLLILFVFWVLAAMARKVVRKAGVAAGIDSSVINLLARSAHVVLLVIGLVTTLGTLGIDVSAIVASLGLTGFAVSFALKDSISNLLSGVLILIHRPFNVGDTIKVKTFEGQVTAIDLRYTKLERDGEKILVPNSLLFTNPISIQSGSANEN